MSKTDWQRIQRWAGVTADGVPGPRTAAAIIAKAGIVEEAPPPATALVTGRGKSIRRIFIHCTATRERQDVSAATIRKWHTDPVSKGGRGWRDIGYHFVIRLDGTIEIGRPEDQPGIHVAGFNTGSIGVVYVGGLDGSGKSKDTRTPAQTEAMAQLVTALTKAYPGADVLGHRDASPDKDGDGVISPNEFIKDCPCFDVRAWWRGAK